jgi:hypothetical protein
MHTWHGGLNNQQSALYLDTRTKRRQKFDLTECTVPTFLYPSQSNDQWLSTNNYTPISYRMEWLDIDREAY